MIEFDIPEEKAYSARINREKLREIKKGIHNYVIAGKRYRQVNYSAKQLAEDVKTNTRYISAAIRFFYGCNFSELVNKLRVEEAKLMLADEGCTLSMEDISYSAGFAKRQSFYNAFAKYVGIAPREYREKALQEAIRLRREEAKKYDGMDIGSVFG